VAVRLAKGSPTVAVDRPGVGLPPTPKERLSARRGAHSAGGPRLIFFRTGIRRTSPPFRVARYVQLRENAYERASERLEKLFSMGRRVSITSGEYEPLLASVTFTAAITVAVLASNEWMYRAVSRNAGLRYAVAAAAGLCAALVFILYALGERAGTALLALVLLMILAPWTHFAAALLTRWREAHKEDR
jgi:hypothetical protein